jgi:hypothetical protein
MGKICGYFIINIVGHFLAAAGTVKPGRKGKVGPALD